MNLREQIILLLRGFFLTPIIATLAKKNIFQDNKIKKSILKKIEYEHLINYLYNLNLLKKKKNNYFLTELGKKIFFRSGSFNIVNSYKNYIFRLEKILDNQNILKKLKVDRSENILGSSSKKYRKFFKKIIDELNKMILILFMILG